MNQLTVAVLLACAVLALGNSGDSHDRITDLCRQIGQKIVGIQQQMKKESDRMNGLLLAGHINHKDQYAAKPEEITQISQTIQRLAREMQAIYDHRDYLQFCVVFEQEKQYKEHNSTELTDAVAKLRVIIGDEQL